MERSEIEDALAAALKEEIDREIKEQILVAYFVEQGWSRVALGVTDLNDIGPWMEENIRGSWRGFTAEWVFSDPNDAVLFKMRWG